MSVINKMLRDLDRRQAAAVAPAARAQARTGIARDTLILNDAETLSRRPGLPGWVILIVIGMVLLAGAGVWWYLGNNIPIPRTVAAVKLAALTVPAKPVIAVAPAAAPVVAASAPLSAPSSVLSLADISLRMDSNLLVSPALVKASKPKAAATLPSVPEKAAKNPIPTVTTVKAGKPSVTASVPTATASFNAVRQSSVQEALAQAQSLWNSGSHQTAIDLLHEALATVERANTGGGLAGNKSVLASLARELARMEMAQGRVSQTLELLTRLEPVLSGVADIWAIRGNAAQRLGRHSESVAAYQMALKLRPNEPRWMLGAAVSLAVQGQTVESAELAEKARAGGALSPEVATYLRQLGVPLR